MAEFTDIHHHIAWEMDDGPRVMDDAIKMLAHAKADGVTRLIATPHVVPGHQEVNLRALANQVSLLDALCRENGWDLSVYQGCEITYTQDTVSRLRDGSIPTLGGSRYALIEFSRGAAYHTIHQALRKLGNGGYIPVIAHGERYDCLLAKPDLLYGLKEDIHCRLQLSCDAILYGKGKHLRRFLWKMLREGLVDYVATDAHDTLLRPTCMRACYAYLCKHYGRNMAARLTGGNQAEIFRGIKAP